MFNFFKKKTIDDLLKITDEVSVRNNIKDRQLIVGFGAPVIVYDYNYITMRSPLRISINNDFKITGIELQFTHDIDKLSNKFDKIINNIKIGDKFITRNKVMIENLNYLFENFDKLGRYSESDIHKDKIFLNLDKKVNKNLTNFLLF